MKFTIAPLAIALAMATLAYAQDESSSVSSTSSSSSSSAPPPGTTEAPTPPTGVCALLPGYEEGNPRQVDYGCTFSSTSTPPYDASSLASYLIGGYRPGKEGYHIEDVASELAQEVVKLYPTLTVPVGEIADSYAAAITASISGVAAGTVTVDGALAMNANKILSVAAMGVAVVAGGAFFL